ncbi:MAG: thiamine pyrophosphate-binding protein [Neomegalonema sp.]|nr:thiamine pyrophosphate-binding protein [Neomegalonema sp.]
MSFSKEAPSGAEIVGAKLAAIGCRRAFGIPGGEVLALIDGLDEAGISFILTKHENAAGFLAEGAWHAESNAGPAAPAILIATLGPGVANAVNVVANAMQERVPMLFLTGCVDAAEAHSYTHQVFDHQAMLRPITKGSFRAETGSVGVVIDKAIALARSGQPGPVHVDLPISVMEGPSPEQMSLPPALPAASRPAEGAELDLARDLLGASKKPLMMIGVDAVNEGCSAQIRSFCEQYKIPVIATYKGKGVIDDSAPLSLGGAGLSPKADALLLPMLQEADLILLVGYDPIEMRKGWVRPWPPETPSIEISPVLRDHGMHAAPQVTLLGSIGASLELLRPAAGQSSWGDRPAQQRGQLRKAFAAGADWGPEVVFETLRDCLPPSTIATADSGAHRILLSQIWDCPAPRTLLQSAALCTMGCAVPLAIGHALVRPRTPTIAFVGDAGLEMGLGELATARDLGLPLLICVLVDESLALIEKKQRESKRGNLGVDFPGSDFPAIAQALGGHGVWIDDAQRLRDEALTGLTRDTFTLLAARIGRKAYDGKI